MAHRAWVEADAHISWTYEAAGIDIENRIPAILGGDRYPWESTKLDGYEHRDRIIERLGELTAASAGEPTRWDLVYEMSFVIVGHLRHADRQRMIDGGSLSSETAQLRTAEELRPNIRPIE